MPSRLLFLKFVSFLAAAVAAVSLLTSGACAADLMEVYGLALKNDPRFQAVRYERLATGESLSQAYARYLPTLRFDYSYNWTHQNIIASQNAVFAKGAQGYGQNTYTFSLLQPIFQVPLMVGITQAKKANVRADLQTEQARRDLMVKTAELYLAVLAAKDNLAFARAEEQSISVQYDLASARFKMGLAPITDEYDARARLAVVKAQRFEAENTLSDAEQALRELTGLPVGDVAVLKEAIPLETPDPDDPEAWVKSGIDNNYGLMAKREESEIAKKEVERQRAAHFPGIDLSGRLNREDTEGTLFGGGSEILTGNVMVNFRLPIYEGGIVASRTREAAHNYSKIIEEVTAQTRAVERQVRAAFLGTKSSISRVESLKMSIEAQGLVLQSKQKGYESGLYTGLAVLDATRDLYFQRKEHARARYDYIMNRLKLRLAAGTLTEEELQKINGWMGV